MTRGRRGRRGRRRPWAVLATVAALAGLAAGAAAIGWASGAIQAPATTSAASVVPPVTGDPRVDALLARMTLGGKLRLLDWAAGTGRSQLAVLPGVAHLGIPPLRLAEGMVGTAAHPAPALAAPLAVAATFSRSDAHANGMVLGRDARALGIQAVARPFAALGENPAAQADRTFGEDPLLAGTIAAAEIAGIQGQGTMAVVAGYPYGDGATGTTAGAAASTAAGPTTGGSATGGTTGAAASSSAQAVGSAALHEIYLQPFEDAVRAGAAGVLCSPGNPGASTATRPGAHPPGSPACDDAGLLTQTLRRELGFGGFVVAGRGAAPGLVSLDSGLDGELAAPGRPGAGLFTAAAVRAAVANGTISAVTVDQAAGAVLAQMDRFGLLTRPAGRTAPGRPAADEKVVARTAQDAATLLKNAGHALPLPAAELGSLALIGPGASQVIAAGTAPGDGQGIPAREPGTWQVLRGDMPPGGTGHLTFAAGDDLSGVPVPASALSHDGRPGLVRAATGAAATAVVGGLDDTAARGGALPARSAHTWTGELTAPATGSYWINLATSGARGTLTLDGNVIAQTAAPLRTTDGLANARASVNLTAGSHTLVVSQVPDGSGRPVQIRLDWVTPAQQQANLSAAVAAARAAKVAVVFAWSAPAGPGTTAGGAATAGPATPATATPAAGPATLPDQQNRLIEDVAAANPHTIVVLNTPGPVSMPWLNRVRAVLEMWYPGDAGGSATANVLLGRTDPAGRLPVTWPRAAQGGPARSGGIDIGYRWYDSQHAGSLFPFGYGLSYTQFSYSHLTWRTARGGGLTVRFTVTNSGRAAGAEVPQVYLGAPASAPRGVAFAPRALAAYTRVSLRPGQATAVTLRIPRRQLQYWDDARGWVTATGRRPLAVGPDEATTSLSTTVTVR